MPGRVAFWLKTARVLGEVKQDSNQTSKESFPSDVSMTTTFRAASTCGGIVIMASVNVITCLPFLMKSVLIHMSQSQSYRKLSVNGYEEKV